MSEGVETVRSDFEKYVLKVTDARDSLLSYV